MIILSLHDPRVRSSTQHQQKSLAGAGLARVSVGYYNAATSVDNENIEVRRYSKNEIKELQYEEDITKFGEQPGTL